jgi:polyisoprenoid-binding protein YceI
MMVTCVRGHFKNVRGKLIFDPQHPRDSRVDVHIDAKSVWSGEPDRDGRLRSATSSMWSTISRSLSPATRSKSSATMITFQRPNSRFAA